MASQERTACSIFYPQILYSNVVGSQFPCADPENFVRGGPTFATFFLVDEVKEYSNTAISGPSSTRQRNAI